MKKILFAALLTGMVLLAGGDAARADAVPTLKIAYVLTTHHMPLMAALAKGEDLKKGSAYLKVVVPKEKYELISDGKKIANIEVIVTKSGSETATLFAMKRIDLALASITAMTSSIDAGTPVKVLSPLHTDGMGLVFPKESPVKDWKTFLAFVKASQRPITIGYHSPTSAPKIVLEGALVKAGLRVTQNPTDTSAQILLVDLKATSNFIPSLASKQVDGYVAPAPFPEVAESKGVGRVVLDLRNLPPQGHWHNFPCCVFVARQEVIDANPAITGKLVQLMETAAAWAHDHKNEVAAISAAWMGIPEAAAKKSSIVYTTVPSADWLRGVSVYLDTQNRLNDFSGALKGKSLPEVKSRLFDFSFLGKQ